MLGELADEFGVSRERMRQIEVCAFEKVKKAVKDQIAETDAMARLLLSESAPSNSGDHQISH
jgi:RNA polymerase sigma-32 factor